VLRKKDSLSK